MKKALYRKYRPVSLDQVVGQEAVVDSLKTAIKKQNISHAYLFTGPRGCGKTSVARIFAHEINHFPYKLEDNYTDIIEIVAASNTGVDNIRELREKAVIAPTEGQYKIYIIDEVHMLSKSAFNALLKILEEPPAHVVFILATTDPDKVPVTITSRAQNFMFKLSAPEIMLKHLKAIAKKEKIAITDDALAIIVHRGGGSFRDSISLLDQISNLSNTKITKDQVEKALGLPHDQILQNILAAYPSADVVKITTVIKDALNSGIKAETIASELIEKIIADPKKEYLLLLSKLPTVVAPFAEAKLLVALLGDLAVFSERYTPAKTATSIPDDTNGFAPSGAVPPAAQRMPSPTKSGLSENTTKSPFSWDSYLASVKSQSTVLYNFLKKTTYKAEDNILNLYPDKSSTKNIFEHDNNQKILISALKDSGFQLKIHEPAENQDSLTSAFSDIMGPVQEVKNGGENPFTN